MAENQMPNLGDNHRQCCGCTACAMICPVKAIQMREDCEGFFYPEISKEKCIDCKQCISICVFKKDQKEKEGKQQIEKYTSQPFRDNPLVYAAIHQDEEIRKESRSGGVFTAVSDWILQQQGIVYGSIIDENMYVKHIRAEKQIDRNKMRGSKYVQSDLQNMFLYIKEDLDDEKKVLFTGTSCQVAGLRSFLKKDYSNLYCIDIICHSVTSDLVWKKYLHWQQKRNRGKCIKVNFRDKSLKRGWRGHTETIVIQKENGKIKPIHSRIYSELYYNDKSVRPSCYSCPYKGIHRVGDITIGDFWGIECSHPQLDDNKGVSLIFENTIKGKEIICEIKESLTMENAKIEETLYQSPLKNQIEEPSNREIFWDDIKKREFRYIAKHYSNYGLFNEINNIFNILKSKISRIVSKIKKELVRS